MSLVFHPCPPPGEWLNDPNGLVQIDGMWRLFVQHRADAPAFSATGWARLSSPDLLDWTWDGVVIRPDGPDWAYSGSVSRGGRGLIAIHTIHDEATGLERQVERSSADAGATWSAATPLIAPLSNVRDPFVAQCGDTMLLACPGDWNAPDARSHLAIWRRHRGGWRQTGRIGPWHPPGVMWEVPIVVQVDDRDVLLVSTVDRRGGGADCAVFAWIGTLRDDGFVADHGAGPSGQRLDLGPDFYAAMAADGVPIVVGWLSSWATARTFAWPGFAGGVISLPRRLSLVGGRIRQHVAVADDAFSYTCSVPPKAGRGTVEINGRAGFSLTIGGAGAALDIVADPERGSLTVTRTGPLSLRWHRHHEAVLVPHAERDLTLFVDGPAVELFVAPDGVTVSVALPSGDRPLEVRCDVAGRLQPLVWHTQAPLP